jgi:hypothetical protein
MSAQQSRLADYRRRLVAIDTTGWSAPQQVDWHVVRAEMNGLDFDHRVLRPWANNPAFYVTVFDSESDQPAREGPLAYGAVELWSHAMPLSDSSAAQIAAGLAIVPPLLEQAKTNLTGDGHDLWTYGAASMRDQSAVLDRFIAGIGDGHAQLRTAAELAKQATDAFAQWLDAQLPSKTGPSGIGRENYDWYLRNVQLVPYTWSDEVLLMEREIARAYASLALEERRNAALPAQQPIASAQEFERRFDAGFTAYMAYMVAYGALPSLDFRNESFLNLTVYLPNRSRNFQAGCVIYAHGGRNATRDPINPPLIGSSEVGLSPSPLPIQAPQAPP